MNNIQILAKLITNDVFELGVEPGSPTTRLQFMGGEYPDNETRQGGLCKAAFQSFVLKSIRKFDREISHNLS